MTEVVQIFFGGRYFVRDVVVVVVIRVVVIVVVVVTGLQTWRG